VDAEKAARDAARNAWMADAEDLFERYAGIEKRLEAPDHDELVALFNDRTLTRLADDYQRALDDAPDDEAATADRLDAQAQQIDEWLERLEAYAPVIDFGDADLDQRIKLLETARQSWATPYVEHLLAGLPPLRDALQVAERKRAEGTWRAARNTLNTVESDALGAGLSAHVAPMIADANAALAADQRGRLAPLLEEASGWLADNIPPDEVHDVFTNPKLSTRARDMLDGLDLDYPISGPQGVAATADREGLFPWTVLSDDQKQTVEGLLRWVCVSLPVVGGEGGDTSIDLVFLPASPVAGLLDSLWMGQTELTIDQYKAVMGKSPPYEGEAGAAKSDIRGDQPVRFVAAEEAGAFCGKLNELLGERATARLPWPDEWRSALTAGRVSAMEGAPRLAQGGESLKLDPTRANFASDEGGFAIIAPSHSDGHGSVAPVRSYPPNHWMFFDLLGNVDEWVRAPDGKMSTMGGGFRADHKSDFTKSTTRDLIRPHDDVGMRIVILPPPTARP
jgi:hypothetical protein